MRTSSIMVLSTPFGILALTNSSVQLLTSFYKCTSGYNDLFFYKIQIMLFPHEEIEARSSPRQCFYYVICQVCIIILWNCIILSTFYYILVDITFLYV